MSVGEAAAISLERRIRSPHALFSPIANGDDALAFTIPFKVVAKENILS